ncbi:hypothetical protein [Salidesulfovibrio brasiliensis]|uniref:hypothetical protein n=1 Tax=Salidesulfovibrio brasiliensis TaxID=221711 RepID=UPI0006D23665|nr:hypothetical protein [Salidesulfovibrio brasiliensis]
MAIDFRDYLEEATRHEQFGRFFKEIGIGFKIVASIQASNVHASKPAETLDDPKEYEEWEVTLRQVNKPIETYKVGVWTDLKTRDWAQGFEGAEYARYVSRDNMPTEEVQKMFDELVEFAKETNHLDSEDDISAIDPDEPIKKIGKGCGAGCASK